jgi:porin
MKIKYKLMITGITIGLNANLTMSQELGTGKESPFKFNASYIGDVVSNFSGGIKTGTTYLGLANIKAGFNTETANWWKGGRMFVNIGNTHGGEPSATMVGDFQGISNIEAGNLSFLYELWYKQKLGKLEITVGLQDLNADFATNESGSIFTNSSFGIQSSIADNVAPPIFPLTALGANVKWNISDTFLWEAAIYDGTPDDFETNPYNTEWKLSKNQGFLTVTELQVKKSLLSGKTGNFKFGVYYHQHNDTIAAEQKNGGFYFTGDQQISNKLFIFSQIGISPKKMNKNNRYFSIGLNCKGPSDKRPNDQVGIAIAYAGIDGNAVGSETAIELTYQFEVTKNIYLRPDIQYIINPAGTEAKLKNALVGFLRFGIEF